MTVSIGQSWPWPDSLDARTAARLAELLERQQRLVASVTSALIYPCLLIVAAIGAVTLLLTEVLPQFVPLFEQSGAKLPASTQFLIAILSGPLLGVVILLLTSQSLTFIDIIGSIVYTLVVPWAAIALTLYYFDLEARPTEQST